MRSTGRIIATLIVAGSVVAACSGAGATATSTPITPTQAVVTPTFAPTATPAVMTDGQGPEHFTGIWSTEPSLSTRYTTTQVGDVTQYRGGVASWTFTTTDARMAGMASWRFSVDGYGPVGPEWGPLTITSPGGSWVGSCTAGSWESGNRLVAGCWLAGADGYEGFTAYYSLFNASSGVQGIEGVIYPGPAPKG